MALTVRELTQIPYLRTRLFAGEAGADQPIAWAHSIELPEPWEWIEAGDLLMTVGLGLPVDASAQVAYVENLAAAGASGIAIGEDMHAPPLSREMIAAAEERALPLVFTAYDVPFVQVSRAVASANQDVEHNRLVRAVRIYDRLRVAVIDSSSPADLLLALGDEIQCVLSVSTNEGGRSLLPGCNEVPDEIRAAFMRAVAARDGVLPGILRLTVGDVPVLVVPVPARQSASLIAVPKASVVPPYALLQHVATVAGLEVERQWAAREELRRLGSETLAQLMDARISAATADSLMTVHGLDRGPFVMVAVAREGGLKRNGLLHHALAGRAIPNMLLRQADTLYCFLPSAEDVLSQVADLIEGDDARIGISDPFSEPDGTRSAAREARWALAQKDGQRVKRYGEAWSGFGPRSVEEAQEAVKEVLGAVIAYDREHGTDLVSSLAVFLGCNRSWLKASTALFVHKQTLVYRIRRVEELTGRRVNDTASVVELWLAVRARELLG